MKDIDELDRLHAAAWGGPWTAETWDVCLHDCETILAPEAYPDGQVVAQVSHADGRIVAPGLEQFAAANTAAIVALHNAWPDVSARLRAAEAEVERLRAALVAACESLDTIPEDPRRFARVAGMTIPLVRGGLSKALLPPSEASVSASETLEQQRLELERTRALVPPKAPLRIFGRGFVRFDADKSLWLLGKREAGWSAFGFRLDSWDDLFRRYDVRVVECGADEHGSWWAVENGS